MPHDNETLLRDGYAAFARGDIDAVREVFAPDIAWHEPGSNHLAGDRTGADAVIELLLALFTETGGTFSVEVTGLTANDVHGAALVTARGERDGKKLEMPSVHVWRVGGGKALEMWDNPGDLAEWDAFWG